MGIESIIIPSLTLVSFSNQSCFLSTLRSTNRSMTLNFPISEIESGDTEFTIVGTKIIPEFDALTVAILSSSFAIFVLVTKMTFKRLRY